MNLQWVIFPKVMWDETETEWVAVIKETERNLNAAIFKTRPVKRVCVSVRVHSVRAQRLTL